MTSWSRVNNERVGRMKRVTSSAYTLLELMLVLAILIVLAAMAWPSVKKPWDAMRLRKAADQVRADWGKTRVRAMKTGHMQVFRFNPGESTYAIQAWSGPGDDLQRTADAASATNLTGDTTALAQEANMFAGRTENLPDGIWFMGLEVTVDARAADAAVAGGQAPSAGQPDPILFYPDGTTSHTHVVLANDRQQCVVVSLRGLTGMTMASDVLSVNEVRQ